MNKCDRCGKTLGLSEYDIHTCTPKTLTLREAAQQALEALEIGYDAAKAEADHFHSAMAGYKPQRHAAMDADVQKIAKAITALRAALAEPVQEPVAWMDIDEHGQRHGLRYYSDGNREEVPLYTAPPQRKPLSEEEIYRAIKGVDSLKAVEVARAVIAAYEAKNHRHQTTTERFK